MPPKRKVDDSEESASEASASESDFDGPPPKKTARTRTKKAAPSKATKSKAKASTGPRLKKSTTPDWSKKGWVEKKLEGEYAQIELTSSASLLAPYDMRIPESKWKEYFLERSALDEINTKNSSKAEKIISEELGQDTFSILRAASSSVSAAILGAAGLDQQDRVKIAHVLRGSLYFTELWGNDEEGGGDNPRTVNAKTRLYSPFGIGSSLELVYNFHWRQFRAGERFSNFIVGSRSYEECDSKDPQKCKAVTRDSRGREKPREGSVQLFDMNNSKIKGTTPKKIQDFEYEFFGCSEWLSPLKLYNFLCAAGTVLHYKENNRSTVNKVSEKFKFFQGEDDGTELRKEETLLFLDLEKKQFGGLGKDEEVCMPQRLLLLAKQEQDDGAKDNQED
ncbi:hypothetical protein DL96DRAFT_1712766 [Flagelloscypha sp. PMI_526]|nr:hypothetical protein DL96DRAFT_1712766 [Flagelloscypha sp. PMI_526]